MTGGITVTFPLHLGADGWMSQKQFDTFYWPSLRKVINALIDEGLVVSLFAEGSYNSRLDSVNEFPKGAVTWMFDQTDMKRAKEMLGNNCGIIGNIPSSLFVTGTPREVKEYSRKLIEICAPGGGYKLGPGAAANEAKLENIQAMVDAAREYGVY
jgi:uroporphyrinogen-III decarboxylase